MKILITGHKGFIGSHLHRLIPEAHGLDLKDGQDIRNCDLGSGWDQIYHLAALRSVPAGEANPEDFISTNCWGTTRLLRAFPDAKIINVSSSSAQEARSVYGATKAFAENIAKQHKNCISVRLYNVFGEGQELESGAVVPQFITNMLRNESPVIYGDGNQSRDFTYVEDVILFLHDLMNTEHRVPLMHGGYGEAISVKELCRKIYGKELLISMHLPARSFDILQSCSPQMILPHFGREEGLKRTIRWWKEKLKSKS